MKPLIPPLINMNGSSRRALIEQQIDVMRAFDALREVMAEAAPHGRDYQLRPDEYPAAREAWMERMQALAAMKQEIEAHAMAIQESN